MSTLDLTHLSATSFKCHQRS